MEENTAPPPVPEPAPPEAAPEATPPAEGLEPGRLQPVIEALLFAADEPLSLARIAELTRSPADAIRDAVDVLNRSYEETGRTFRVHRVAQGYQLYTTADYAEWVRSLYQHQYTHRLSRAALEVLAIVAYNQPVTRPEIEKLRGVDCSGPIITLLERRLVATAGRAHRAGNPFLYRTTREFLRYFGLERLEDLPRIEELGEFLAGRETGAPGGVRQFESLAVDYGNWKTPDAGGPAPDAGAPGEAAEPEPEPEAETPDA